jgi:Formate/nitrite transporter
VLLVVEHETGSVLLGALAFSIGFVALLLGHSELFTEGFLVPVTTVVAGAATWRDLARLWLGTLVGNLAGGWIVAWLVVTALPTLREEAIERGSEYASASLSPRTFALAVLAGAAITLTSDYYGGSAPCRRHESTTDLPCDALAAPPRGRPRQGSHVHCVPIDGGGAQLCSDSLSVSTPQTFLTAPAASFVHAAEVASPSIRSASAAARPISARLEPVPHLRRFNHWFTRVTPTRLARRTRTVWQYRSVPALSGLLSTLPGASQVRLPSASTQPLRRPGGEGLSPPLGNTAPRGARERHERDPSP